MGEGRVDFLAIQNKTAKGGAMSQTKTLIGKAVLATFVLENASVDRCLNVTIFSAQSVNGVHAATTFEKYLNSVSPCQFLPSTEGSETALSLEQVRRINVHQLVKTIPEQISHQSFLFWRKTRERF